MDLVRKCAIAVVMLIPAFVSGGLVWSCLHSWWAVLAAEVCVVAIYFQIISGTLTNNPKGGLRAAALTNQHED